MVRLTRKQVVCNAKNDYCKLKKKPIYSPALKSDIYFSNKGWNHLAHNGTRSFDDVYRRIKLLPYVKSIVSKIKTYKTRSLNNGPSFEISSKKTINICGKRQVKQIKVVIILTLDKKYTFLSVM